MVKILQDNDGMLYLLTPFLQEQASGWLPDDSIHQTSQNNESELAYINPSNITEPIVQQLKQATDVEDRAE